MAGRRHHIIPRFLLVGFPKEIKGDQIYAWRYASAREPVPTNVINIAVEGDFYGKPGEEANADPAITEIEKVYAPLIAHLRRLPAGAVQDERIGSFIMHITARTKHVRESFAESTDRLLHELSKLMADPVRFGRVLRAHMEDDAYLMAEIRKAAPRKLSAREEKQMLVLMRKMIPSQVTLMQAPAAKLASQTLQTLRGMVGGLAANGQIKALIKMPVTTPKSEIYSQLQWHLEDRDDALILGDSVAVFLLRNDPIPHPYPEDPKNIEAIYLPIAQQRLLVGKRIATNVSLPTLQINRAVARCSREYYVSGLGPEVHGTWREEIGQDAIFFGPARIEEIARESFGNLLKGP